MNLKEEIQKLEIVYEIMLNQENFDSKENILASFEVVQNNLEDGEGGESIAIFASYRQALLACEAGKMFGIIKKFEEIVKIQGNFIQNQSEDNYASMGKVSEEFLKKVANFCEENGFDYSNLCGEILSRFTKVIREIASEKIERTKQLMEK